MRVDRWSVSAALFSAELRLTQVSSVMSRNVGADNGQRT
jgi:hypothetical protein